MPLLLSLSNSIRTLLSFFQHSNTCCKPQTLMAHFTNSSSSSPTNIRARLRGVVFDMDGTLTVPAIDFAAMYKAVLGDDEYLRIKAQSPYGINILHQIENWAPDKQRKAYETIADYERQGLDRLEIMPGAAELCSFLDSKKIREFGPYKPDPAPLLHICSTWEVQPNEVIMVGDSLKDDVACGKQAGAFTCLLDQTGRYNFPEHARIDFKPDFTVASLAEVHAVLEGNFDLSP